MPNTHATWPPSEQATDFTRQVGRWPMATFGVHLRQCFEQLRRWPKNYEGDHRRWPMVIFVFIYIY